jgi:8-oxo-dGTP pyrophosphatase MutT (NUDIX family)
MRPPSEALELLCGLSVSPEEVKSRELILSLLEHTQQPYSRNQFHPGHITCTALVLHPAGDRFLLMYHHRHLRWLLPGGHVEESDVTLADAARREAIEETAVKIAGAQLLAGIDVHAIPPHKESPFHLHHDLVFALTAASDTFACTKEAPRVTWCIPAEFERFGLPPNIRRAAQRAMG